MRFTLMQSMYPNVGVQPISRDDCRNPCISGKCHIRLRESGGPFKDLMVSFHFS